MSTHPAECVVLVPFREPIDPQTEAALDALERRGYTVRRAGPCTAIDLCRSMLASQALADGYVDLMWIDSDVRFDPDSVVQLRARGLPFITGLYPKKDRKGWASEFSDARAPLEMGPRSGLRKLRYAAFGFALTRACVYADAAGAHDLPLCGAEPRRFRPYFLPLIHLGQGGHYRYLGEDYAFCQRYRDSGGIIYADCSIRLWHIGPHAYTWEDVPGAGAVRAALDAAVDAE